MYIQSCLPSLCFLSEKLFMWDQAAHQQCDSQSQKIYDEKKKKGKKKALYEKYRHSSKCGVWGVAIFPVTNTRKTHFSSRSKMWWCEVQDRDWVFKTCLLFLLRLTLMDSTRIFCHHWRTSGLHNSRCNWWFTKPSLFPLVTVLLLWLYLWNCGSLPWDRIQKQPLVFSLFVVHHWLI